MTTYESEVFADFVDSVDLLVSCSLVEYACFVDLRHFIQNEYGVYVGVDPHGLTFKL